MPLLNADSKRTTLLYDSVLLGAADTTARLFQIPRGQGGKTKYDTNMVQAGQIPLGKNFEIRAISWAVPADQTAALDIALSKGHWELNVSDKVWAESDFIWTPSGSGLYSSATASAELNVAGYPSMDNLFTLEYGITLQDTENFSVDCEWPTAPTAAKFWVILWGVETRKTN